MFTQALMTRGHVWYMLKFPLEHVVLPDNTKALYNALHRSTSRL